jgi:hypothetical protein
VDLGGELVARHADRFDERLGRQLAALEAVDQNLRVGAGKVHQLPAQFVGIVRQRLDLFAGQHAPERDVAIGRGLLTISLDSHGGLHAIDRQDDDLAIRAGAEPHIGEGARLEAGELRRDRVTAWEQVLERHLALRVRLRRFDRDGLVARFDAGQGDVGCRQHATGFVEHSNQNRSPIVLTLYRSSS